jgi:hypothetical protein
MRDFASVDQVGEYFSVRVLDAPKAYRTFEGGDIFFQFPRCRALAVHMPRCLPSTDVALSQWETYLARPPLASLDDVRVEDFWAQWSCGGARESRADLGASLKHNPPKRDPKWVRCSQVASEQQRIASGRLAGEYVLLYRTADGRAVYWGDDPMALRPTIAPRVYWHRAADDDDASGAVDADGAPTDGDGGGDSGGSSSLLYRLMPVSDRNTDEFYLRLLARHRPTRSHADLLGQKIARRRVPHVWLPRRGERGENCDRTGHLVRRRPRTPALAVCAVHAHQVRHVRPHQGPSNPGAPQRRPTGRHRGRAASACDPAARDLAAAVQHDREQVLPIALACEPSADAVGRGARYGGCDARSEPSTR